MTDADDVAGCFLSGCAHELTGWLFEGVLHFLFPWFDPSPRPPAHCYLASGICVILTAAAIVYHHAAPNDVLIQRILLGVLAYFVLLAWWYKVKMEA
jgi:hypothetical protein